MSTKEQTLRRLAEEAWGAGGLPDLHAEAFRGVGHVHDWRHYVPEEVQALWPTLTECERLLAFIPAAAAADREEWE